MTKEFWLVSPLAYGGHDQFAFTYHSGEPAGAGQLVEIPFGRRASLGVVMARTDKPDFKTKPIARSVDIPPLPPHLMPLAEWLAKYYLASPQAVWQTILPAGLTRGHRGSRKMARAIKLGDQRLKLTPDQARAVSQIQTGQDRSYLLHGVTGSGKTQVYIELAKQVLDRGQSSIILVPEIALTPQIVARFSQAMGEIVIAWHSRLTPAQRFTIWQSLYQADSPWVVIGPRSALFLPLAHPGLIVLDEAHETSYKQDQAPRYQADATAAKLAELTGAKLVLGTATPTLTQSFLAQQGKISLVELPRRIYPLPSPKTEIIDLRQKELLLQSRWLSRPLLAALEETLVQGRQSLLFINRRGSASSHLCSNCGYISLCPNCQLPLTFHADQGKLVCHYCNYRIIPPAVCPPPAGGCGQAAFIFVGGGTKRVETEVKRLFPRARIARLDKDSATTDYIHELYTQLQAGQVDILIGTQIIAKGLDLPQVDTVGVVLADTMLYLPDFTASERTYQLLHQVRGRTGRRDRPGRVFIQSYTPDHPAITAAAAGDYQAFAARELAQRQLLGYPPYRYLLKLTVAKSTSAAAQAAAAKLASSLKGTVPHRDSPYSIEVLGPAPSFITIRAAKHHWQLIIKGKARPRLIEVATQIPSGWIADIDPINLL